MKKNSGYDSRGWTSLLGVLAGKGALGAILLLAASARSSAQDLERVGSDDPVKASGSVGVRGVLYGSDGIANRRVPFSYTLTGGVNLDIYDLSLPFSFVYSEQERGISQPFNQFGVSPHYKWLTAHVGFRNLTFSPYTLAGHQILGAGIEMNPGNFRFGFIAGRLQRSVEEDTSAAFVVPAYERSALSGKIGYGTEENHIDLIMLKGKDDPASLSRPVIYADVRPAENLVAGVSGRLSPVDGLSLSGELALSDYTRDIRSDELNVSAEIGSLGSVIPPRASTQLYMAINAGLAWRLDAFSPRWRDATRCCLALPHAAADGSTMCERGFDERLQQRHDLRGARFVVCVRTRLFHVRDLRQFELHGFDAGLGHAIVTRDVAALEAPVRDGRIAAMRAHARGQRLGEAGRRARAARRAEVEVRQAPVEEARHVRADRMRFPHEHAAVLALQARDLALQRVVIRQPVTVATAHDLVVAGQRVRRIQRRLVERVDRHEPGRVLPGIQVLVVGRAVQVDDVTRVRRHEDRCAELRGLPSPGRWRLRGRSGARVARRLSIRPRRRLRAGVRCSR